MVRRQSGIQNLTIDYSTDTNGRILSAAYTETGGFTGNFTYVYDNYGNIIACKLDYGDIAKAVLINPNNGAIDTRYDPNDIDDPFSYIDDPFSYRARDGFMGIGPLWANNDDGTVYMQGHIVIPNSWGDAVTNGTTTTTTDDTTDKDGGDDTEPCDKKGKSWWEKFVDCLNGKGLYPKLPKDFLEWAVAVGCCSACYLCYVGTGGVAIIISAQLCYEPCSCCSSSFNLDPIKDIVDVIECIFTAFFQKD